MPRATCAELIALSVLCCMLAMSRSDRQYSTGVICEEKIAKRTEMENQTNDEKEKRRVHTRTNGTWYLVRPIPAGTLCDSKESTGLRSARLLTPPATLAQGRMQLTETCK